jgi:hypothetical protein
MDHDPYKSISDWSVNDTIYPDACQNQTNNQEAIKTAAFVRRRVLINQCPRAVQGLIKLGYDVCIKQDRPETDYCTIEGTIPAEQTWIAVENDLLDYFKAKLQELRP